MSDVDDLTYFQVVRTVAPVPAGLLTADVAFEAQVTRGLALQADVSADVIEILLQPVKARIVNGVLMKDGVAGVSLLSAAQVAIDGGFSYMATFTNARIDGVPLAVRDVLKNLTFDALDTSGTFDLKDAAPIVSSTAVPAARGPRGYPIDNTVYNATTHNVEFYVQSVLVGTLALSVLLTAISGGAPGALDTLKELADALGDDANFATTVTNALAGKVARPTAAATLTTNTAPTAEVTTRYDATAGPLTVTLAALSTLAIGTQFPVEKFDATVNTVTLTAAGSDTFLSGGTTEVLRLKNQKRTLQVVSVGGTKSWDVVWGNTSVASMDGRYLMPVDPANTAGIFGAALVKNTARDWYGTSYNVGNVGDSFGFGGGPYTVPATTTTAVVTFPLFNATIPVANCAQLNVNGGSFLLGGVRVAYLGRSASSGAGNATGCFTAAGATGTVASGTAPTLAGTGFFGLTVYQRFGYDGRPNPGSTQGFGVVTSTKSPTVDDSFESGSFVALMADSGSAQTQHNTVTGGEMTAQLLGNWLLPDGYTAALTGGGVRTSLSATDHAKNVIGLKITPQIAAGGFMDGYDGIYQSLSGLQLFGTLNGSATFPQSTVAVTGTFPPASATYPVTVRVGGNGAGMGGTVITYTGQSGGNLTGCTGGTGTWASGSNVANTAYGVNVKDPVLSNAGFLASASAWSGNFSVAVKGSNDSSNSMVSLTGPTDAEVSTGLTVLRLNAGVGQTKALLEAHDSAGNTRFQVSYLGSVNMTGVPIAFSASGVTSLLLASEGYIQLGVSNSAWSGNATQLGVKMYSGAGAPGTALIGPSGHYTNVGDWYIRTDGAPGSTIYKCTALTGSNPPTSITWTAIDSFSSSTSAVASTLAQRDSNANLAVNASVPGFASTATAAGTTTLTVGSTEIQEFTGSTTQTVLLPTTGVVAGQRYTIINQSTGAVTVQSSGANTVLTLAANGFHAATFIARVATPTTAANWEYLFSPNATMSTGTAGSSIAQRTSVGNLNANSLIPAFTSIATAAGTTTLTSGSAQVQAFTGSTTQTVALPTTSVVAGQSFTFVNTSSGAVTINSSGGNLVKTLAANTSTVVTALVATPTTAAHWFAT